MKQDGFKDHEQGNFGLFGGGEGSQGLTGGFMILLGSISLLGALGITIFGRSAWWLMAFVPVYWIFFAAFRQYRQDGGFSRRVFGILIWALIPFAFVAATVLELNVGAIWPLGIIAVGVCILLFNSAK